MMKMIYDDDNDMMMTIIKGIINRPTSKLRTWTALVLLMTIAERLCGSQVVFLGHSNYPSFLYIYPGTGSVSVDNRPDTSVPLQLTIHPLVGTVGWVVRVYFFLVKVLSFGLYVRSVIRMNVTFTL